MEPRGRRAATAPPTGETSEGKSGLQQFKRVYLQEKKQLQRLDLKFTPRALKHANKVYVITSLRVQQQKLEPQTVFQVGSRFVSVLDEVPPPSPVPCRVSHQPEPRGTGGGGGVLQGGGGARVARCRNQV